MCTIVALHRVNAAWPLVIAANRDEMYTRRTTGPGVLLESPRTVGGRDLEKGGTWMGVTEAGLFVGVTNQRSYGVHDDTLASRGQMVLEALATGSVDAVGRYLGSIDARAYNAFNLLFGDAHALRVAYARRDARAIAMEPLGRGTWILANDRIGSPEFPKSARAAELARDLETTTDLLSVGRRLLTDHSLPPIDTVPTPPPGSPLPHEFLQQLQALCIHTPVYGTRSAALVAIAPTRVEQYLVADGPPCVTEFRDWAPLLKA